MSHGRPSKSKLLLAFNLRLTGLGYSRVQVYSILGSSIMAERRQEGILMFSLAAHVKFVSSCRKRRLGGQPR